MNRSNSNGTHSTARVMLAELLHAARDLSTGKKVAIAATAVFLALLVLANQPLYPPERYPPYAGEQQPARTLTGAWANETREAYTTFEYRADHTFEAHIQPKTLYGRLLVGTRRLSGVWQQPDSSHVAIAFENVGKGKTGSTQPNLIEIRFDSSDTFTVSGSGQQWHRINKSP